MEKGYRIFTIHTETYLKMIISREEKFDLLRRLMWDYNITPEECLEVLEGTRTKAGHYTDETLFRKLIESYPWFTVLKLLSKERILQLMSDQTIHSIRNKSLISRYEFIRARLQKLVQSAR